MPMSDEVLLRRTVDQERIREVTVRYGRGCDRLDFDLVRSCFTDDAIADYGIFRGDVDGLIALIEPLLSRDLLTTHYMLNHEFEFVTDDVAYVETMIWGCHRQPPRDGAPLQDVYMSGRYADRFERRDGEWKIAHRLVLTGSSRIDPVREEPPVIPGSRPIPRGASAAPGLVRPESPPTVVEG